MSVRRCVASGVSECYFCLLVAKQGHHPMASDHWYKNGFNFLMCPTHLFRLLTLVLLANVTHFRIKLILSGMSQTLLRQGHMQPPEPSETSRGV